MSSPTAPPAVDKSRKPNKIIPVPQEYRVVTLMRERDTLVKDILLHTGCTVVPRSEQGRIVRFDIYGAAVDLATTYINTWIVKSPIKSKASSAWAKMPAFNADDWYYKQVTEMEAGRKQMFKGPAPEVTEDAPKLPSIIVDWPEDLRSSNTCTLPRDAFGSKLVALNELRMRDEVFINELPNNTGQVEIMGFDNNNIRVAAEHYQTMIDKVRADSLGTDHGLNIILDENEGIEVSLEEAGDWWPNCADGIVPRLLPHTIMYNSGTFREDGMHSVQLASIQQSIEQALEAVRRKKGCYDFAVRLGCLVLASRNIHADQIGKTFPKRDFKTAINSRVGLSVKKWAYDNELGWKVHHRLVAAQDLLEPTQAGGFFGYMPKTLEAIQPMFRGTWVFRDPDSSASKPVAAPVRHAGRPAVGQQPVSGPAAVAPPSSLFVVQIDWIDDENGEYEKLEPQFYKLAPGKMAPKVNMEIILLELGESRGWSFALESLIPVPRQLVSPALLGFAKQVSMQKNYDVNSNELFARWDTTPTIKKHMFTYRVDRIYSFGIQKTCYKVEHAAMWYPGQEIPVWGLSIRHMQWTTHLAELERLPVGDQADWGDNIATFFPDDGLMSSAEPGLESNEKQNLSPRNGIRVLMEKILQVSEIVSSATAPVIAPVAASDSAAGVDMADTADGGGILIDI
ncbi:hypothetical protein NX059_002592 [Plenodomus lindquistii]|nr:hypothetical protein NX059_002592 [Plenodomus lindquistii]